VLTASRTEDAAGRALSSVMEAGVRFFSIPDPDFVEMFVGRVGARVRDCSAGQGGGAGIVFATRSTPSAGTARGRGGGPRRARAAL